MLSPATRRRRLAGIAAVAFAAAAASAWLCQHMLGALPHVADEVSYVFQARILAAGRLWIAPPPLPQLFAFDHIVMDGGKWRSIYPPGWPLLLAAGWLIRAPWILNPLLLFLSVIGTWRLAALLFDERTAWIAAAFFICSPFVLLMHSGFMAHPAALCLSVWSAVFFLLASEDNRYGYAAGIMAGLCFLTRPVTAAALIWPCFLWLWWKGRNPRHLLHPVAGLLPAVALYLIYNLLLFGRPLEAGYNLDSTFHPQPAGVEVLVKNLAWYFRSLNQWMWEWPWPALFVFLPLVLLRKKLLESGLLGLCSLSLVFSYSLYDYRDIVYAGPRYAFEAMGFFSILAAQSLLTLLDRLAVPQRIGTAAALFLAVLSLLPLPKQVAFHSQMYHSRSHEMVETVRRSLTGSRALVMIGGNPYVYGSFFFENALEPAAGDRVFIRDLPGQEDAAFKAFPRDQVWRVHIDMQPIAGPNSYPDRWTLTNFQLQQLQ